MPKTIFPLGLFTLDVAKGRKETNLYPILVPGTQSLARKKKDLSLFISDLIEVCLKGIFRKFFRERQETKILAARKSSESDLDTNISNRWLQGNR